MTESPSTHRVQFHDMAHGGEGVARLGDGRAVFVAGGIPGETAEIRLVHEKKNWARGEVVELIEASPDRIEPPCPYFGECGGCQWQHLSLERQRAVKTDIVRGQLVHLGRLEDPPVEDCRAVGPEDGFHYRNHAGFSLDAKGQASYHRARSRDLVAIDHCPLLHPLLQEWHENMPPLPGGRRLELRVGTRTGQRLAMVRGRVEGQAVAESRERGIPLTWAGAGEVTEMVHSERLRISSKSFFQVNTEAAELLVDLVMEMLDPGAEDAVIDAYAGIGLFTVPLARRARQVHAIERNAAAVRDLRHHVRDLGETVHVVGTEVEQSDDQLPAQADLIVADPPREGLGNATVEFFARRRPRTVALVSCDPASCARDVRAFVDRGYRLERVVPVDQFPQTYHVEIVSQLVRVD